MGAMLKKIKAAAHKRLSAGFTVEASVIVPICMLLMVTALFLAVYMHDKVTVKAAGSETAVENAEAYKQDKKHVSSAGRTDVGSRVLMAKDADVTAAVDKDAVTVRGSASFPIPLFMVRQLLGESADRIQDEISISHLDARDEILKYKATADGMSSAGFIRSSGD